MCSTPQKQPAARVALAAPSGTLTPPPTGPRDMLWERVKGRNNLAMKDGMVVVNMMTKSGRRYVLRVGVVAVLRYRVQRGGKKL